MNVRCKYLHLFFILLILLSAPFAKAYGQAIQCPTTAADTTGWPTYDEGSFSLKIPPRFKDLKVKSVDSQGGKWKTKNATIYYDFGTYSNPLDPDKQGSFPGLTVCQEGQGPDTPRIVVYYDEDTETVDVGAHWAVLPEGFHSREALTISGAAPNEQSRAELLAVIQSVRFTPEEE